MFVSNLFPTHAETVPVSNISSNFFNFKVPDLTVLRIRNRKAFPDTKFLIMNRAPY